MHYDFLIIGQGLAGSTLAFQLLKAGKKVMVLDNQYSKSSSRVAAGLFNAITGNKFVKTSNADVLFEYLFKFYREAETLLGTNFLHELPIYRPFDSIEKQNLHLSESSDIAYQSYIDRTIDAHKFDDTIYNQFGGISIKKSGFLNTTVYIEAIKEYLLKNHAFIETEFIENQLVIEKNVISYCDLNCDLTADKIIFCRGWKDSQSPFWSFLPFASAKGEILYVTFEGGNYETIINRGCWILPMPQNKNVNNDLQNGNTPFYKVGATYEWDNLDENPTEHARKELVEKLEKLTRLPYKIIKQVAGVRPATIDRKPLIGHHFKHENVMIFNGFGAKGVSLIPYYSQHFADVLLQKTTLDKDIDIKRLKKYIENLQNIVNMPKFS